MGAYWACDLRNRRNVIYVISPWDGKQNSNVKGPGLSQQPPYSKDVVGVVRVAMAVCTYDSRTLGSSRSADHLLGKA